MINCKHQYDYWEEECSKCDGMKSCQVSPKTQTEFFLPMKPPTKTHQMKKVRVVNGKPVFYEPPELAAVRAKLQGHLSKHVPKKKYTNAVRLIVKWCFPKGKHPDGSYKTTKPDTDNLQKMLKDVMTDLGYWTDDALVASEIVEKFWAVLPGIYIKIEELSEVER
ncbi:RusA family crossover junction endodeoxyribonuclease [Anaerovorax sp. IOR16]|uniref:RusA family crossover junction endodeoxyribonuclease n=1 Tax=Anaerovorax sp. IOR16 TaxID=2773458 RepID=UPI002ED5FA5A